MFKIIVGVLAGMLSVTAVDDNQRVIVNVTELKNAEGECNACLYSNADAYPDDATEAVECKKAAISGSSSEIIFENVAPGTYAISIFHDENKNGELDTNFLGIPQEGYGASGNVLPKMSAPSFEDNSFAVSDSDVTVDIKLKY